MNKISKTLITFSILLLAVGIINGTIGGLFNVVSPNEAAFFANKLNTVNDFLAAIVFALLAIYFKKND